MSTLRRAGESETNRGYADGVPVERYPSGPSRHRRVNFAKATPRSVKGINSKFYRKLRFAGETGGGVQRTIFNERSFDRLRINSVLAEAVMSNS